MKNLFKFNQKLSNKTSLIIEISGLIIILITWFLLTANIGKKVIDYSYENPNIFEDTLLNKNLPVLDVKGDSLICKTVSSTYIWYKNDEKFSETKEPFLLIKDQGSYFVRVQDEKKELIKSPVMLIKIVKSALINKSIIPSPGSVLKSYKELHYKDFLVRNTLSSIKLNLLGYLEAIVVSLLLGFVISLIPFFRSLLSRYIDAIRFIPLTAVTGLFIAWFGIETNMKVQFLAFGIIVYLLPVVVQRFNEIDKIYLQTSYTLGASNWQNIRYVYWPFVTSKIFDDIRVLTAISWTYIIVAELVNKTGGVGALIFTAARQSRLDKVFAVLIIIVVIGVLQDKLFLWLDKKLFPYKHI